MNKNLQESLHVIEDMKNSFADKLKKEGQEYLEGLEKDMREKTAVLEKLEVIIKHISELSTLYK